MCVYVYIYIYIYIYACVLRRTCREDPLGQKKEEKKEQEKEEKKCMCPSATPGASTTAMFSPETRHNSARQPNERIANHFLK